MKPPPGLGRDASGGGDGRGVVAVRRRLLALTVYFHVPLQVIASDEGLVADVADVRPFGGLPRACQSGPAARRKERLGGEHSRVQLINSSAPAPGPRTFGPTLQCPTQRRSQLRPKPGYQCLHLPNYT